MPTWLKKQMQRAYFEKNRYQINSQISLLDPLLFSSEETLLYEDMLSLTALSLDKNNTVNNNYRYALT